MSPKAKAAASASKKETKGAKGEEKAAKADKKAAKGGKAAAQAAPAAGEEGEAPAVDPDELEEAEESAAAQAAGGNSSAAAQAAASTEMSASFKNFRHHPDMENFYRFIYENDLRHEALAIIDDIMIEKAQRKQAKGKSAH